MPLITITLCVALVCLGLVAITLGSRLVIPLARRFVAFSQGTESMESRVFPMLAFLGLFAILIKLTVF